MSEEWSYPLEPAVGDGIRVGAAERVHQGGGGDRVALRPREPEPEAARAAHLGRKWKWIGSGQDPDAAARGASELPRPAPEERPSRAVADEKAISRPGRLDELVQQPAAAE